MDRPSRIALVHPTYWPEVRRGSERFAHDLGIGLTQQGHRVSIVTTHRGLPTANTEDDVEVVRSARVPRRLERAGDEPLAHAGWAVIPSLMRRRFDVLHVLHLPMLAAILRFRPLLRGRLVLSLMGYPDRRSIDAFPARRRQLEAARDAGIPIHVLSEGAARSLFDSAGIESHAINPGTRVSDFAVSAERAAVPTIFCAANPADPRKRVDDLVAAFAELRQRIPDAELVLDGGSNPQAAARKHEAPGVEVTDGDPARVANRMASAWLTVLPSEREAFGLVVVESLAAGTPAVVAAGEGAGDVVQPGSTGERFDHADPPSLVDALHRGLDLAHRAETPRLCRERAANWDWDVVTPRLEELYDL